MAKSKKKNKLSRLGKLTRVFNVSSTRGKMLVFLISFAIVGGGYMAYQTFAAATKPPYSMTQVKKLVNVTASDGIKGNISCGTVAGQTGYGPLARCLQTHPTTYKERVGLYSPITNRFAPSTDWMTDTNYYYSLEKCSNINNFIAGPNYSLNTGYGPLRYGQIYRYAFTSAGGTGKWQIKWAHATTTGFASDPRNCYSEGVWMDAKAW